MAWLPAGNIFAFQSCRTNHDVNLNDFLPKSPQILLPHIQNVNEEELRYFSWNFDQTLNRWFSPCCQLNKLSIGPWLEEFKVRAFGSYEFEIDKFRTPIARFCNYSVSWKYYFFWQNLRISNEKPFHRWEAVN